MNIHSIAWRSILRLQQIYPKEVGEICSRIGLPEKLLLNQNLTLPIEMFLNFFIQAESVFDDELISINYSRMAQIRPNYAELLGLIFVYSRHLKESFKLLQTYINIELEGINVLVTKHQDIVKIQFIADPVIEHTSLYENLCLSMLAGFIRSKRYAIKHITTKIQPRNKPMNEKSVFNCPINFSGTETSIVISHNTFMKKNNISNPNLVAFLSSIAQEKLQQKQAQSNMIDKVETLLCNYENNYNNINIEGISSQLGMSVNSFRNQLSKNKTNFRQTFNQHKLKRAKQMLKEGQSVKVISYLLGYAEPSSFIRWFISQTNLTPTTFKKDLQG
ncbi:AraC family transcriptional regulator [Candidatus Thioglobus sp.]|nr:AraC family transcriptional regulator [Candidatus Thioglobus sp.]